MNSSGFSLNNFNTIDEKILYICRNEYSEFFNLPNVVGVGLGYKISGGFRTNEKCITVLVSKKLSANTLPSDKLIPQLYKGIITDVYESGIFQHHLLNSRVRPILGGYSISCDTFKLSGSIGCIVIDKSSNYFVLSCNHVLAGANRAPIGANIVQPSTEDNGKSPRDLIGYLYKFVPLQFKTTTNSGENYVDAALALIPNKSFISNNIYALGKPRNPIFPTLDLSVRKAGRTTDISYGYIKLLGATLTMHIGSSRAIFKDQIVTTLMSSAGDSGALLMNLENNSVGLIIGGSPSGTVASPINAVLNALNVKIFTN